MRTTDFGRHAPDNTTQNDNALLAVARALLIATTIALTLILATRATAAPTPGASGPTGEVAIAATAMAAATIDDLVGTWEGALDVGGATLRLVMHLTADDDGGYTATLDSPDQGARGIPVAETVVEGDVIRLTITAVGATYEGRVDPDAEVIRGTFVQGGSRFPLELKRVEEVSAPNRPQTPRPPFPYDEEEVVYPNPEAGITLAGTLTLPHTPGPHPVVLLITGSGPQDRDETVFDHKPFLIIADHLARHDIAVLRVDDRGVGASTGDFSSATTLDFASDVAAGVAFLKTRPEIDAERIGLIGHSEGGLIAPIVATESDDVAFIVLLAGPGLPGEQILHLQSELILRANGEPEATISANRRVQETMFRIIREEDDADLRRARMRESLTRLLEESGDHLGVPPGSHESFIEGQIRASSSDWFRFFLTFDPRPVLERVYVPVLALNGSKDLQVPAAQNLAAIEAALRAGGNARFEVRELPGLNHGFQTAETGSPTEYRRIEETFSPVALEALTDWILQVAGGD